MKPKILLSANLNKEHYIDAVNKSGGIAVAEYCPEFSNEYDGLILCGGNDINPIRYNEEMNGAINIDEQRDEAEFKLLNDFLEAKKPVMGICRGHQLINIAFGGSLCQHISDWEKHRAPEGADPVHEVTVSKNSILYDMYGESFCVNSCHHQAVKEAGKDIEVIATTSDGKTVEAIRHRNLPILGIQWHPERICYDLKREDTVDGDKIFKYFIELCK